MYGMGESESKIRALLPVIANEPAERRRSAGEAAENNRVCGKILDRAMKV